MAAPVNPARPDWEQIGRYLAGESSPDEAAAVRRWMDENREDAELVASLDAAARRAARPEPLDVEAALRRVKSRAAKGAKRSVYRMAGFAAAAAVFALAAVLVPWQKILDGDGDRVDNATPQRVAFSTQVGQRDSLRLPDGSFAILGPDSRIDYSSVDSTRLVQLRGQAFFRVEHDATRSFIVRTGATSIRDIGTAFSVSSTPAEPVRVVVHEGAVVVTGVDSVTLREGDVAIVGRDGMVEATRGTATPDDLAWSRGSLVFRNASLADVAADLRRWYGVELRVSDTSLLRRHFTGSFAGEPVDRVLEVLALAIPMRIERRGDSVYARPVSPTR